MPTTQNRKYAKEIEITQVPEELQLVGCDNGVDQLIRDIMVEAQREKPRRVRPVDCTPAPLKTLVDVVPTKILEIRNGDEFGYDHWTIRGFSVTAAM